MNSNIFLSGASTFALFPLLNLLALFSNIFKKMFLNTPFPVATTGQLAIITASKCVFFFLLYFDSFGNSYLFIHLTWIMSKLFSSLFLY